MQRIETNLPGVIEIRPKVFGDTRGFFLETYHRDRYADIGISDSFVQDNHSRSSKDTLRGLHYQLQQVEGEALDIAVDIRRNSPNFGKWTSVHLTAKDQNQVYIPAGFAHGFLALTDTVQFLYKCSDFYSPADEHGVLWNDPDINIAWRIESPLISTKDANNLKLADIPAELLPSYSGE